MNYKEDFVILNQKVNDNKLVYFDNSATSQKPISVIDSISDYYKKYNANIHRAHHYLGDVATELYENARNKTAKLINADGPDNIVFTKGTTEGINLISSCLSRLDYLQKGDEVIISTMEHHANIVPWQLLEKYIGIKLKIIDIDLDVHYLNNNKNIEVVSGQLKLDSLKKLITNKTKLISIVHVANSLGVINPVKDIIDIAKEHNIPVLIDGAQAVPHMKVDVKDLDCDFYVFSGHKMLGPTGIGGLYAKSHWLNKMPPYQGGGEMISKVSFDKTEYQVPPYKFEAGTPNIAGAIGLSAAIDYINDIGYDYINKTEHELYNYLLERFIEISELIKIKIVGYTDLSSKAPILSFVLENLNSQDVGTLLDQYGVAVRTGHHCNMPLMESLKISGTIRASLSFYNTKEDVDIFIEALKKVIKILVD
tara:strand:+ start:432 stop:1700 length:1269 start_codon:yes stop_codon:yes gene_type:complete